MRATPGWGLAARLMSANLVRQRPINVALYVANPAGGGVCDIGGADAGLHPLVPTCLHPQANGGGVAGPSEKGKEGLPFEERF